MAAYLRVYDSRHLQLIKTELDRLSSFVWLHLSIATRIYCFMSFQTCLQDPRSEYWSECRVLEFCASVTDGNPLSTFLVRIIYADSVESLLISR